MCTQSVAIVMSTDTPEPEPLPEPDYLMPKSKLLEQKLEIIPGEKKGSEKYSYLFSPEIPGIYIHIQYVYIIHYKCKLR